MRQSDFMLHFCNSQCQSLLMYWIELKGSEKIIFVLKILTTLRTEKKEIAQVYIEEQLTNIAA